MLDVITTGESLAVFSPDPVGPIGEGATFRLGAAGAESNVAVGIAGLGASVGWHGRLGDDPFGAVILDRLAASGVDTASVEIDPDRPTGLYVKDPTAATVHYRRAGSAASVMDVGTVDRLPRARITHVTGVTAALSPSCADYLDAVVDRPGVVAFDVNHRPALWRAEDAAPVLLGLARRCDVVLVGLDEALSLWGTPTAAAVRSILPGPATLVVKDGPIGATAFTGDGPSTFVAAPPVDVVEPVGAGDAFAAGYLAGVVHGLDVAGRLRLGHTMAGRALRTVADVAPAPTAAEAARLIADARAT